MIIIWPSEKLPSPTIQGYGISPGEAILRTEMEAGPARQRRRFTQVPSRINVRWVMTQEQFAVFEAWYRFQAKEGAEWFLIELKGGLGLLAQEARFTRQFQARVYAGVLWEVSSELEIRERPTLDEGTLALLLEEDLVGLQAAIDELYVLVHQTLPLQSPW